MAIRSLGSLWEGDKTGIRIATPVCALVRNDIFLVCDTIEKWMLLKN